MASGAAGGHGRPALRVVEKGFGSSSVSATVHLPRMEAGAAWEAVRSNDLANGSQIAQVRRGWKAVTSGGEQ